MDRGHLAGLKAVSHNGVSSLLFCCTLPLKSLPTNCQDWLGWLPKSPGTQTGGGELDTLVTRDSFLPLWDVTAPTAEPNVTKELKLISSQSVQVGVGLKGEHRIAEPWPGLGHAQLSHCFSRNAARLECKAGAQMSHAEQERSKPKVFVS